MLLLKGDKSWPVSLLRMSVYKIMEEGNKKGVVVKLDLEKAYDKT